MFGREPAILIAALVAIAQGVMIFVTQDVTATADFLIPVLTVLAGLWTRFKVIPTEKVKDAGIHPETITQRAKNPSIPRAD